MTAALPDFILSGTSFKVRFSIMIVSSIYNVELKTSFMIRKVKDLSRLVTLKVAHQIALCKDGLCHS